MTHIWIQWPRCIEATGSLPGAESPGPSNPHLQPPGYERNKQHIYTWSQLFSYDHRTWSNSMLRGRVCGFYLLSAHSGEQSFQEILPAAPVSQQFSALHWESPEGHPQIQILRYQSMPSVSETTLRGLWCLMASSQTALKAVRNQKPHKDHICRDCCHFHALK